VIVTVQSDSSCAAYLKRSMKLGGVKRLEGRVGVDWREGGTVVNSVRFQEAFQS